MSPILIRAIGSRESNISALSNPEAFIFINVSVPLLLYKVNNNYRKQSHFGNYCHWSFVLFVLFFKFIMTYFTENIIWKMRYLVDVAQNKLYKVNDLMIF